MLCTYYILNLIKSHENTLLILTLKSPYHFIYTQCAMGNSFSESARLGGKASYAALKPENFLSLVWEVRFQSK